QKALVRRYKIAEPIRPLLTKIHNTGRGVFIYAPEPHIRDNYGIGGKKIGVYLSTGAGKWKSCFGFSVDGTAAIKVGLRNLPVLFSADMAFFHKKSWHNMPHHILGLLLDDSPVEQPLEPVRPES